MIGMLMLADITRGDKEMKESDTLFTTVPDKIADWVVGLNEWRLGNHQPMPGIDPRAASASTKKVGRIDPCPCGSGKEYKRCCGPN